MLVDTPFVQSLYDGLDDRARAAVDQTVDAIVASRRRGGKVMVVTGSGPNIHEGVTTLIAELIRNDLVHAVSTSSAVVAHEMAGALDRVHRVRGEDVGIRAGMLPRGGLFEATVLCEQDLERMAREMLLDTVLYHRVLDAPGEAIIKAAGNMAYPMGLRTERLAIEIEALARTRGLPFETVAGLGADPRTMIGAGALHGVPVLVSVPQLIGGGMVGLCIGDSTPMKQRSAMMARMLAGADVIIESGVVLSQEIHDGPFETYTGHGIWSAWEGQETYSLRGKTLVRIDLDPTLQTVCDIERGDRKVQQSIDQGLPKTKTFKVPFRMEMSGFARLEGSIPVIGDLGVIWPIVASRVAEQLGIALGFLSSPQESEQGKAMRAWIVENVAAVDRELMLRRLREGCQ